MKKAAVATIIGVLVMFLALAMCIPLAVAYLYSSYDEIPAFLQSMGISFVVGLIIFGVGRHFRTDQELRIREAFGVVAIGWTIISLLGALPFWLAGDQGIPVFLDAFFEKRREYFGPRRKTGARKMRGANWGQVSVLRDLRVHPVDVPE